MQYEIDLLPVGEGERSGDAIALRYGENGKFTTHVIDGGDTAAGEAAVAHIKQYYGNPSQIDHVVVTHGDDDHSSGVRRVIEAFEIGAIYMNRPWLYAAEVGHLFKDERWTVEGLTKRLRSDFPILADIEDMAKARGIPIYEAFQGTRVGTFTILSPSRSRYLQLIPQFSRTPAPKLAAQPTGAVAALFGGVTEAVKKAVQWIQENWGQETLEEDVETSPSNESSVVQIANLDGSNVLLTGDAGVISLHEAADFAAAMGITLPGLAFMQMPHHGSRHNVSPSTLNRWLGRPLAAPADTHRTSCYASVGKECDTHPRRKVVNAFLRRGALVAATKGFGKRYYCGLPQRSGWSSIKSMEFSNTVEG